MTVGVVNDSYPGTTVLRREAEGFAHICDSGHRPEFFSTDLTSLGDRLRKVSFGLVWDRLASLLQGEASGGRNACRLLVSSADSA